MGRGQLATAAFCVLLIRRRLAAVRKATGAGVDDADRGLARAAPRAAERLHDRLDGHALWHLRAVERAAVVARIAVHDDSESIGGEVVEGVADLNHGLKGRGGRGARHAGRVRVRLDPGPDAGGIPEERLNAER